MIALPCAECGVPKSIDHYYTHPAGHAYAGMRRTAVCKPCTKEKRLREYWREHRPDPLNHACRDWLRTDTRGPIHETA